MTTPPDIGRGSESLKLAAGEVIHALGRTGRVGEAISRAVGLRVVDPRLNTTVAGISFENPVMVGAGEDKAGRLVDGFRMLGFAGVEVGTVTLMPQPGNPRPRLFVHKRGTALNRMGFNSPGAMEVGHNLDNQRLRGVVGINVGKNKDTLPQDTPEEHAQAARRLQWWGDYLVINLATLNTPGARDILRSSLLADIILAVRGELDDGIVPPLFVKTTVDLELKELDTVLQTCLDWGVSGVIDTNTTVDEAIKARYGWQGQPGGVSGSDPEYRRKANERMKHITRETRGTGLHRIGVGAIDNAASAIERMQAGAEVVQVVTGIRRRFGLVAPLINRGLLKEMKHQGLRNISELVGTAV